MDKSSDLKSSYYNHFVPYKDGKYILFNAHTLATCVIDREKIEEVSQAIKNSGTLINPRLQQSFADAGYLIPDHINEKNIIQKRLLQARKEKRALNLTIAPTLGCNFNCPYCFESEASRANFNKMSVQTQEKIVSNAKQFCQEQGAQSINITWFGGEPLLAVDVIKNLSMELINLSDRLNLNYAAEIITNGYKLNENNIKILLDAKVYKAQITIDGPSHIHDVRRILKNGKGTYEKIVANIRLAVAAGMSIAVRINIDQNNIEGIQALLIAFEQYGLKDKVYFYLGHVASDYDHLLETVDSLHGKDYAHLSLKTKQLTEDQDTVESWLPQNVNNFCGADSESSFMLGPQGELYQCWDDFGDQSKIVGNINSETVHNQDYIDQYMLFDPTVHPKCSQCTVMPLCMGGCPKQRLHHQGEPQCGVYKYNLNDWLVNYAQRKEKI